MATYRYATKDLSITNAEAFIHSIQDDEDSASKKESTILYAVLGKNSPYTNEPEPEKPEDNEQYLHYDVMRNFIGGKKVTAEDASHVTERVDWVSGEVYSMYRDRDEDMYDRPFYVLTDEMNVYKCLYNNKGAASTVKPTGFSTVSFGTSDGYIWKYMFTVTLGDANKFLTSTHIPVRSYSNDGTSESDRALAVQGAAVNGAIEVIETNQVGSGYHQVANGQVAAGGKYILTLDTSSDNPPSSIDNFYTGGSVYVKSGTGAGQLRRIINWEGSSRTLTVNTAFATVCNSDSRVIISPTVTVIGDGKGAKAYTQVDEDTGGIKNITVIDTGRDYTRAKALISANSIHGAGATANVVMSPLGGHGSNPIRELYADKVCLNVQFDGIEGVSANGNGYIPTDVDFRSISILKDPVLKCDANNNITAESVANTSNSPDTLRFTTRMQISYLQMANNTPVNPLETLDVITNERNRLRAELGELEFVTELNPLKRADQSMKFALQGANAHIVHISDDETESDPTFYVAYINNVESYGEYAPFTKDDVILKAGDATAVATVETIKGPEANTFSGEVIYTENTRVVTRDPDQIEDIKIILDF